VNQAQKEQIKMSKFVICIKGANIFAGTVLSQKVDNRGTFSVHLADAVDLTGNREFESATWLAINGPLDCNLTDSLPEILLSHVETILGCRETATIEFARAIGNCK
jgi:hypothetical protein